MPHGIGLVGPSPAPPWIHVEGGISFEHPRLQRRQLALRQKAVNHSNIPSTSAANRVPRAVPLPPDSGQIGLRLSRPLCQGGRRCSKKHTDCKDQNDTGLVHPGPPCRRLPRPSEYELTLTTGVMVRPFPLCFPAKPELVFGLPAGASIHPFASVEPPLPPTVFWSMEGNLAGMRWLNVSGLT